MIADRYLIQQLIGQGGMGQVFASEDQQLKRQVVLKVAHKPGGEPSPEDQARFEREALKMASLNHPNIVTIFDYDVFDGKQFLVMELVNGITLKRLNLQEEAIDQELFTELITQLLNGIQNAHDHDVIHRDLKPSNLMWDERKRLLKILDFGLARGVEGDTVTETGHVHGSIQYMAPEQIRGEPQGPATDLYAIGILAFQLLAKKLPFNGDNTVELMFQKLQRSPLPLLEQPNTPTWVNAELASAINHCLSLSPADRPASAQHCLAEIKLALPNRGQGSSSEWTASADVVVEAVHQATSQKFLNRFPHSKSRLALFIGAAVLLMWLGRVIFPVQEQTTSSELTQANVTFNSMTSLGDQELKVDLSINGQPKGQTPVSTPLELGTHEVIISQDHWSFKRTITIERGGQHWVTLPAPPPLMEMKLPTPAISSDKVTGQATEASTLTVGKDEEAPAGKVTSKVADKRKVTKSKAKPKKSKAKRSTRRRRSSSKRRKPASSSRSTDRRRSRMTRKKERDKKRSSPPRSSSSKKLDPPSIDVPLLID